ncbi:rhodanese-related sulfurtransferase [Candidatus Woesearchaeota archaeon]|nr:rhodanese-related sulfurtransferase [Candidatus Woesearchaeota archaeon]
MIVTSFYKYCKIASPEKFRLRHQKYCDALGIKGKVLVGTEGINASVSGTGKQIAAYKKKISSEFKKISFKDTAADSHPFKKMIVRIRPEIVTFGSKVDLRNAARHISPGTLKRWMENENIVLLDARNDYESRIGKFRGAIAPDISTFSEFPKILSKLNEYRGKKIVTYCTGGIRCEKASALLKERGFENVYQLQGGVLNFIQQYPDSHFEGRCFVFDSRLSVPAGKGNKAITTCDVCTINCDRYINCKNEKCDKMFVCCDECQRKLKGACSKKCRNIIPSPHGR